MTSPGSSTRTLTVRAPEASPVRVSSKSTLSPSSTSASSGEMVTYTSSLASVMVTVAVSGLPRSYDALPGGSTSACSQAGAAPLPSSVASTSSEAVSVPPSKVTL